jgi:asparagine synthase (glutamine-hydrolysing)
MNHHLHHRGPNGDGIYLCGPLALGHVRLSILDLSSAGAQPMISNRWALVFNGEIYNYQSLRTTLANYGYSFISRSDTEVLLNAWDYWGDSCLTKLEGMFAFAIFDIQKHELHLCRDSYGVKPLYYSWANGEFLFSSELSTLVHAQAKPPELDIDAIGTYLALHYVPAPQTGLMHLAKLPSGHRLCISITEDSFNVKKPSRWNVPFTPQDDSAGISLKELDCALARSVHRQMVSDVPLGAFLSGGVDSSLICYYASKVNSEPLHTFSVGFTDAGTEYDETHHAARAANILGTHHHPVSIKLGSLSDHIYEILGRMGELNADSSVFLNYIVCAEARKYVTVCLSGAGGDELFGGYYRHQALLALELLKQVPQNMIDFFLTLLKPFPQNRDKKLGNFIRRLIRFLEQRDGPGGLIEIVRQDRAFQQQSAFLRQAPQKTLLKALEYDFNYYLSDNILCFSDKMSMLHGLEVRVPFLDSGVIKLAEHMQNCQRVTLTEKKILLKRLAVRYFPHDLIYRKKQGFAAPVEVWLRQLSTPNLKSLCKDGLATQVLPESLIDNLVDNFIGNHRDLSLQIYSLIVMNHWYANL